MSRRGRRRPLARLLSILLLVAALLAVAGIGASVVRSGDERDTGARGAASPAKVRVATIAAVHRGAPAIVRFSVHDAAHATVGVRLVVTSAGGDVVKTLRLGQRTTNAGHTARFPVRLPAGRYTCTVEIIAGDVADTEGAAAAAPLHVLAPPPRLVPDAASIARAVQYLRARSGTAALAVVDTHGAVHGCDVDEQFTGASVVKAMIMVQYLRTHDTLDDEASRRLTTMITGSDNDAAYAVYEDVGADGLRRLAKLAGMRHFTVGEDVLHSLITAADQARFFWSMDEYLPAAHRAFARSLLSGICRSQTWGVADVARPEWQVLFKSGWLDEDGQVNRLVNQVARLERGRLVWSVAVLTDDNPAPLYALETLRGVTACLLGE